MQKKKCILESHLCFAMGPCWFLAVPLSPRQPRAVGAGYCPEEFYCPLPASHGVRRSPEHRESITLCTVICKMFPISFKQIRLGLPGRLSTAGGSRLSFPPRAEPQIWDPSHSHSHKYLLMSCERKYLFPFWTLDENFIRGKHLQNRCSHKLISGSICLQQGFTICPSSSIPILLSGFLQSWLIISVNFLQAWTILAPPNPLLFLIETLATTSERWLIAIAVGRAHAD